MAAGGPIYNRRMSAITHPHGPLYLRRLHLAKLGLGDSDLSLVANLMGGINDAEEPVAHQVPDPQQEPDFTLEDRREELLRALLGENLLTAPVPKEPTGDTVHPVHRANAGSKAAIKLYVAEEQLVMKEAYRSFFSFQSSFEVLGISSDTSEPAIRNAVLEHRPEVLLLGLKELQPSTEKKLEVVRGLFPDIGLVLLFAYYDSTGIKALREHSSAASGGYAHLLKHNIDTADQLGQVVYAVAQNRIIVDPEIMEDLVDSTNAASRVLNALSPKEMQVLSWMAKGLANEAIAAALARDKKAVERQVSNIYSKLHLGIEHQDPRVGAALMYLTATGLLFRS